MFSLDKLAAFAVRHCHGEVIRGFTFCPFPRKHSKALKQYFPIDNRVGIFETSRVCGRSQNTFFIMNEERLGGRHLRPLNRPSFIVENEICERLGHLLYTYTQDGMYGKYFEGRCTLNFDNPFVVFEGVNCD